MTNTRAKSCGDSARVIVISSFALAKNGQTSLRPAMQGNDIMTFDPFRPLSTPSDGPPSTDVETLQDVLSWITSQQTALSAHAKRDYRNAILRVGKLQRRPLSAIPADATHVLGPFPDDGYKPDWAKTFEAFRRWKRNVSAALNGATGKIQTRKAKRARHDSWRELMDRLQLVPWETHQEKPAVHKKKLIAVGVLADAARDYGLRPNDLSANLVMDIYLSEPNPGRKRTLVDAARFLDRVRQLDNTSIAELLPQRPIAFNAPRSERPFVLPAHIEDELSIWIDQATRGSWCSVDLSYSGSVKSGPFFTATRKILAVAAIEGHVDLRAVGSIAFVFCPPVFTQVVRSLQRWHRENHPLAIQPHVARQYLKRIATFLTRNGECADHVYEALRLSYWLNTANAKRSRMPRKTQELCRRVVTDRTTRLSFLSLHIQFRAQADRQLRAAEEDPSNAECYLDQARALGACAAFAALETDAVPVRIGNALSITFRGKNPWLILPFTKGQAARLFIPAEFVKNGKPIRAPIVASSPYRGLETIFWYLDKIRPLFPHAESSDFLFPAVEEPSKALPDATLRKWWNRSIGHFGFPGMRPHMFRHGQASILVSRNPGNWPLIKARLGDSEKVCIDNYTWIDEEGLVLRGQELLAMEFNHVA